MPKKDKKAPKKGEKAKKLEPVGDEVNEQGERQALVKRMEDTPYDRATCVSEVRILIRQTAAAIIEVGRRLLILKENEQGNFMRIVEEEIGIPYRSATRFMHTALKAGQYPAIERLATVASSSKVYALLEAPEEELRNFEQTGLFAGEDTDGLAAMSRAELRALVREMKEKKKEDITKATAASEAKCRMVQAERDALREAIPSSAESKAQRQIEYCRAMLSQFSSALNGLIFSEMELEDAKAVAAVGGMIQECYDLLSHTHDKLEAYRKGETF